MTDENKKQIDPTLPNKTKDQNMLSTNNKMDILLLGYFKYLPGNTSGNTEEKIRSTNVPVQRKRLLWQSVCSILIERNNTTNTITEGT